MFIFPKQSGDKRKKRRIADLSQIIGAVLILIGAIIFFLYAKSHP